MSMNGKFFRSPAAPATYDTSEDDDDDDSDNEQITTTTTTQTQKQQQQQQQQMASANLSSEDDDDDDEDDNDDDDSDNSEDEDIKKNKSSHNNNSNSSNKRKSSATTATATTSSSSQGGTKKKKSKTSSFFDEEAEDDDDEDDEEEYGTHHDPDDVVRKHYTAEDIRKEQMDDEAREIMLQQDRRRQRAGLFSGEASDLARQIEERHLLQRRTVDRSMLDSVANDEGDDDMIHQHPNTAVVSQQSLVPSVNDPSLWMFSCAPGKEKELVFQIMNKCIAYARQGKPLGITSAVAAQSKGRVYVESYSEPSVMEAVQGIRQLLQYTMRLVPINDMTTVMTVVSKNKPVNKNEWVRMCRGHYKGDLALVKSVRESGLKCMVQCVPRIDLSLSGLPPEEARIRRRTVRPPQKFFNPQEVAAIDSKKLTRKQFRGTDMDNLWFDVFENNYYHDGYLLKEVTVGTMVKACTDDDPPTLDELQRFRKRNKGSGSKNDDDEDDPYGEEENEGSKIASSLLDELSELQGKTGLGGKAGAAGGGLIIGDTVEVMEGDLIGMQGKLISMDDGTVKVHAGNELGEIEFLATQVRKHVAVGAHVKVTTGRYANETGTVVAVEQLDGDTDYTAILLTDMTHKEVSVRISQLQESAEIASGQDKLAGYELHDLVVLSGGGSANEVAVIVRVGREEFTIINNHGIVRDVRPEELRGKRNASSNRAVALDVQGQQIRVGQTVRVAEGPHKGKSATIKRMSRAQLFLYSQTRTEHAGIFVVRSRSCVLAGTSKAKDRNSTRGVDGASPYATPRSQQGSIRTGMSSMGGGDSGLAGKTVRIQAGQWKGYLGVVVDATATHVKVELHSRLKKIMVMRERVVVVGDKYGAVDAEHGTNTTTTNNTPATIMAPSTPFMGGATPLHSAGGATPMHGGATPMHDSMSGGFTPSHSSSTDDVWRPGGSIDRNPADDDDDDANSGWGGTSTSPSAATTDTSTNNNQSFGGGWGDSTATTITDTTAATTTNTTTNNNNTWAPTSTTTATATTTADHASDGSSVATSVKTEVKTEQHSQPMLIKTEHRMMDGASMSTQDDDGVEAPVWFMERVCVSLKTTGASAVLKNITGNNTALMELASDNTTMTISSSDVTMVEPKEHDMVLVTKGADVGVEGELVCIDGDDAILKDANEDFKIVDYVHLAKIETNETNS